MSDINGNEHKNYNEEQIQVLEGLEAVRKRPGMYIGTTSLRGLHHLVFEIVSNSIDEALAGRCDNIDIIIRKDNSIMVTDNGSGIPVGIHPKMGIPTIEVVHTILHAGGKFGGGAYSVSGGLHGVGASVVNALSEYLEVEVSRDGKIYKQRYERGKTITPLKIIGDTDKTGTKTTFKPDSQIFDVLEFDFEALKARYREMAFLNKCIYIKITDERPDAPETVNLHYDGGIISFVEYLNKNKDVIHEPPIYFDGNKDNTYLEISMQYNSGFTENIYSFVNNVNTIEGGTHLTGFKAAITKTFNDYARKYNYLKENDKNLQGEDIREGLSAVINLKLENPQFEGQTKTKLGNSEIRGLVEQIINENLGAFLEENPKVSKQILDKCLMASRAREAARKARESARKQNAMANSTLPGKLADCTDKNPENTEIYIVEGDSAGGSAKSGRTREFQAILPLWGKMLNVEKARIDKVYGNEKLMPVVTALGTGIGEDFDITKLRYGKVIIMADADVDGSHIRMLLLTFFFRYMKALVERGHVYIAMPPLYKIEKKKGRNSEVVYVYTEKEKERILEEKGWSNDEIEIQRYKGLGEMDAEQLWETTMNPETRSIIKVEMDDIILADEIITALMGDKVDPRKEFIHAHAHQVSNLDI